MSRDYALITDFEKGSDTIQVTRSSSREYEFRYSDFNGDRKADTGIFFSNNLHGVVSNNTTITVADLTFT